MSVEENIIGLEDASLTDLGTFLCEHFFDYPYKSVAGFSLSKNFAVTDFALLNGENVKDFCHTLSRKEESKFSVLIKNFDVPPEWETFEEREEKFMEILPIGRELAECGVFPLQIALNDWGAQENGNYNQCVYPKVLAGLPATLDPVFDYFSVLLEIAKENGFDVIKEPT